MAVRLFVGNLSYSTTEADLRTYFGAVAPPSQVVLPVDRETGRPRGFAFVEFQDRAHAERAIQQFNGQVFNGRPLAVSEARAREDRGPGGPPPGPRPRRLRPAPALVVWRTAASVRSERRPAPPRSRNFGPDAKPQRGGSAKAKKKESERPRGPIPLKNTGRSFTLDDADTTADEAEPIDDDFATSKPEDETDEDKTEAEAKAEPAQLLFVQRGARCNRVRMCSNAASSSSIMRGVRVARAYTHPVSRTSSWPSTRAQKNCPSCTSRAIA